MNIKEVMSLMGWSRIDFEQALAVGVTLRSGTTVQLKAEQIAGNPDIAETDLDEFIGRFAQEDPERNPPIAVRRHLLVEARHRCGICRELPARFQFHHILLFSKLKHHDTHHMIAICGSCHDAVHTGHIDQASQYSYKRKLEVVTQDDDDDAMNIGWDDLQSIISALCLTTNLSNPGESRFDFSDIDLDRKNELNNMSDHYFALMKTDHEPYFSRIDAFLRDPMNEKVTAQYHQIVDDIRTQVALRGDNLGAFQVFLQSLHKAAIQSGEPALRQNRKALHLLLSYMYFNCDIGRKA